MPLFGQLRFWTGLLVRLIWMGYLLNNFKLLGAIIRGIRLQKFLPNVEDPLQNYYH